MQYNLNEDHKKAANFFVTLHREEHIPLEFRLRILPGEVFSVTPFDQASSWKDFSEPRLSNLTIEILAGENFIFAKRQPAGREREPRVGTVYYKCALLSRIFMAVETNFGEIETKNPIPIEIGGIGLNLPEYYRLLAKEFSLKELDELCFQMNIDRENFPTEKDAKCMELVKYVQRHGRLLELLIITAKARPRTDWTILWS